DAGVKLAEEIFRLRWWQTSPVTKESAKEPVKTIAQGRPDDLGKPVVIYSYAFHFACEAMGATGTRLSLRPLSFEERNDMHHSGANVPREGSRASPPAVFARSASERSNPFVLCAAGWIASLALAMTVGGVGSLRCNEAKRVAAAPRMLPGRHTMGRFNRHSG
ncbi:MAG TPA: hypothetical protein VN941_07340, partial [Bradyrhizobium sp.]|nr:hypothetical protein [Bradyrhizobium sp.]